MDEVEATRKLMGEDFWDYTIEGSLPTLETLMRYLYEQGLTEIKMKVKDLFADNINSEMFSYLHGTSEDN